MDPQLSQLEILRESVAEYLRTVPALAGVSIVTRAKGDIVKAIEDEVAKVGVCLEVYIVSARITSDNSEEVVINPAVFGLAACEDLLVSRDPRSGLNKTAYFVIEQATVALKMTRPGNAAGVLEPDEAGFQEGGVRGHPLWFAVTQNFSTIVQIVPANA